MLRKCLHLKSANNFHLLKHLIPNTLFATQREIHKINEYTVDSNLSNKINEILGKYNEEDKEKMLKIVNNISDNDILGYDISKVRAKKLILYRKSKGSLQDLSELFHLEGFGLKFTDKFYQSLLSEKKDQGKKLSSKMAPFVTPPCEPNQRQNIHSCVAVRIGVNSITWSKLDLASKDNPAPCQLSHWQHHNISENKLHLSDLIQRCMLVCHKIPHADCYLLENPQMAVASTNPGSVEQQNVNIQKAQVIAMVGYTLASRITCKYNETEENQDKNIIENPKNENLPCVFYVRRFLAARLFNRLVGTERVSSEDIIVDLMRTTYNVQDIKDHISEEIENKTNELDSLNPEPDFKLAVRGKVNFPMHFREMFADAPRIKREFLGQSLLLNLAFIRLVLLQDSKSIAVVTRVGRNKTDDAASEGGEV